MQMSEALALIQVVIGAATFIVAHSRILVTLSAPTPGHAQQHMRQSA